MNGKLVEAMADLNEDSVLEEVKALKALNVPTLDIIAYLQEGLSTVGKKFEEKEYFLPELMMSAEIFKEATEILGVNADSSLSSKYGIFVIGTIYGDIHDLGKNIVATVMSSNGFDVIDLGVDVPTANFIEAIKQHKPKLIGISCLLTSVFDNLKECIQSIEKEGLRQDLKILIGGGPVDDKVCKYVGADQVCKSAQEAIAYFRKYIEVK